MHIEGMGVLGMQVAWEFARLGIPFTWDDNEAEHTAWHCSTGIVYPSGDERDLDGLRWWMNHAEDFGPLVAETPYVYGGYKNPPHGGRYNTEAVPGSSLTRSADWPAIAVNVPELVRQTRERYADLRTEGRDPASTLVVAHSIDEQRDGYLWGWAARVTFDSPLGDELATYYSKAHRFDLTYAYPIPGDGQWWAGSTLGYQGTPKERDVEPYVERWIANAERLLELRNIEVHSLEQGWRPRRFKGVANTATQLNENTFALAPEPTSGLRHGPLIVGDLFERMGL